MGCWTMAFVGNGARENYEATLRTRVFRVASNRTPVRRARAGDEVLLYLAGEGFVGEARIRSPAAATPQASPGWSSEKPPSLSVEITRPRRFVGPVRYRFPQTGKHAVLGFHRYALTGGFVEMSRGGFEDVLARAVVSDEADQENAAQTKPRGDQSLAGAPPNPVAGDAARKSADPRLEKRAAGQHALAEGRKRAALWTVAEMGASAIGLKGAERYARGKVRSAERTWIVGGRAEERVGVEVEKLAEHGFYAFHDVPLPGLGNVDHVVLGERGFFCIETKSHKGRITAVRGGILVNERPPEKDFVKQTWRGCYRLREVLGSDVMPLLLFTDAFVEGRLWVRGVRVLPLSWLIGEMLGAERRHDPPTVKAAVNDLGAATGSYPSVTPRVSGAPAAPWRRPL